MSRRMFVAVMLFALSVGCSAGGAEGTVEELVQQVRLGDPQANATYNENLEILTSEEALPVWISVLESEDAPEVHTWAARVLGTIGDPQAVPALTEALKGPRDVRDAASSALKQIGEEEAAQAYATALADAPAETQILCLVELERLQAVDAIPAIADAARQASGLVATQAATTLGGIGDPAAAEPLASLATDTSVAVEVRQESIRSLARLGGEEARQALEQVVTQLEEEGNEELLTLAQETIQGMG